jgi:hypothetical protein
LEAKNRGKKTNRTESISTFKETQLSFVARKHKKRKLKILILIAQVEIKVILHDMQHGTHYDYNKYTHIKGINDCSNRNNINVHSKHIRP